MYYRFTETETIEAWLYCVKRGGYNNVGNDFSVNRTHLYPYNNLHYVVSGQLEVVYLQKKYIAKAGEYFILPSFKDHSYRVVGEEEAEIIWIEYDGSESEAMTNRLIKFNGSIVVQAPEQCLTEFVEQLQSFAGDQSIYEKSKNLYSMLIDQLSCMNGRCSADKLVKENDPLANLTEYIDQHLKQELKVADLASYFGFSTSYMIKMFKKRYDMTPGAYIYHRRLAKAKHLLVHDPLPLEQIAELSGFYDAAHLVRRFKKDEGMTPMTYKAEAEQYKIVYE